MEQTVSNQHFIEWLQAAISVPQFEQLLIYLIAGSLGIVAHFWKRKIEGIIVCSFYNYFFSQYPGRSLTSISTFIISAVSYIYTGMADGMTWPSLIGLAFSTGYMLDSSINKSDITHVNKRKNN